MKWAIDFFKILKEQSVNYCMAGLLISFTILIFPNFLSIKETDKVIGMINFRQKYLEIIIIIFLISLTCTSAHCLKLGAEKFNKKKKQKFKKQKLNSLTPPEIKILKYYIENKTKTQELWVSKGEVWGLKKAGIIWLAVPHPEEIVTGFCDFNIDDYCWDYLHKYPNLLD